MLNNVVKHLLYNSEDYQFFLRIKLVRLSRYIEINIIFSAFSYQLKLVFNGANQSHFGYIICMQTFGKIPQIFYCLGNKMPAGINFFLQHNIILRVYRVDMKLREAKPLPNVIMYFLLSLIHI